jgi:hypothetical protein
MDLFVPSGMRRVDAALRESHIGAIPAEVTVDRL